MKNESEIRSPKMPLNHVQSATGHICGAINRSRFRTAMNEQMIGTFLICPDCSGGGKDTINIELSGGLIYEVVNADMESCSTLQSGTKVVLPLDSEVITASSTIDLKGGKLQVCDV